MQSKRTTLKEVAAAANVDPSTVSRALNPKTRGLYRAELISRIEQIARELGYQPNATARGLRTNRSMMVGVLIPDITNPIFPPIVRGIEDALEAHGYAAIIANADAEYDRESNRIDWLRSRGIDGLIVGSGHLKDNSIVQNHKSGLPVVMVNRRVDDPEIASVVSDDQYGIEQIVKHVYDLNHRSVGFISGPQHLSTGRDRYEAFLKVAKKLKLENFESLIVEAKYYNEAEGARCTQELLDRSNEFTAIISANDLLAIGASASLKEFGIRCPEDVSVTGFNDMPFVDRLNPPLTTVRIESYKAGYRASEILLKQIHDTENKFVCSREVLPVQLMVRGSTGPA